MRAPVLITPASTLPVSLNEAKLHLRVAFPKEDGTFDETPEDGLINGLILGAVSHLDGWTGILGRCICEQTWRVSFDRFCRELPLPLGPVMSIVSVTWRNADGETSTVSDGEYLTQTDAAGNERLVFRSGFDIPTDLHDQSAVTVTYKAGYPVSDGKPTAPAAIKVAILLMVGHWYENRETVVTGTIATELPFAANALLAPFRRMSV